MSLSCYVYYRVRTERAGEASMLASAVMRDIAAKWPVSTRLAKKVGEPLLRMEIYEGIDGDPESFIAMLDTLVAEHGLEAAMPDGERRHVEIFECV